jgi:hypothetical protein
VNEIAELKFIVLKLQTYTMDVNKMLLEERQSTVGTTATERSAPSLSDLNERITGASSVGDDRIFRHSIPENDVFMDDDIAQTTEMDVSQTGEEEVKYTLSESIMEENNRNTGVNGEGDERILLRSIQGSERIATQE